MEESKDQVTQFTEVAERPRIGLARELAAFMMSNKKWWLAPILMVFVIAGVLLILAESGAAPFIYTLF